VISDYKRLWKKDPFSSDLLLGETEENHKKISVIVRIPVHWVII